MDLARMLGLGCCLDMPENRLFDARKFMNEWRPETDPPKIEPGNVIFVIVALRKRSGGLHVKPASYMYEVADAGFHEPFTGFFLTQSHTDYEEYYVPIEGVEYWMPMPTAPDECEHRVLESKWCSACNLGMPAAAKHRAGIDAER